MLQIPVVEKAAKNHKMVKSKTASYAQKGKVLIEFHILKY